MKISVIYRGMLFVCLLGVALLQLRLSVIAQSSYSGVSPSKAMRTYQRQPHLLVAYGRQAVLEQGNFKEGTDWYTKALSSNPFYVPAWIALGQLRNDEGNIANAKDILQHVDVLTTGVARWRWDAAMFAYLLGRQDIVTADLAWLIQHPKVGRQTKLKAAKLAFTLWPNPEDLVKKMGRASIEPLFSIAVRLKKVSEARALWLLRSEKSSRSVLPYINLLIANNELSEAARVWKEYYSSDRLLYNGRFTNLPVNSGFGWRIRKIDGVLTEVSSAKSPDSGLHLHFTGGTNLRYAHVQQIIPLEPEHRYVLTGLMKSEGLTTSKRPYLEINGFSCSMERVITPMVQSDQDWTPFVLNFTLPENCEAVHLRLRRDKSKDIDNRIKGDLWLNDFVLTPMTSHIKLNISELNVKLDSFTQQDGRKKRNPSSLSTSL